MIPSDSCAPSLTVQPGRNDERFVGDAKTTCSVHVQVPPSDSCSQRMDVKLQRQLSFVIFGKATGHGPEQPSSAVL